MKIATETIYICEFCESSYAMKEDCESCEKTCAVLRPIIDECPSIEDIFDSMSSAKKFKMAEKIYEAVKRHLESQVQHVDDSSRTVELRPPGV